MALPTSPPISLNNIKAEFGATGTRRLTEFYRGGAFVPNTAANAGVPTSGPISLLDFLGAAAYTPLGVSVTGGTKTEFRNEPAPVELTVSSTATRFITGGGGATPTTSWTYRSGDAGITPTGSTTGSTCGWSANVPRGATRQAIWRCTVTDGTTTASRDFNVSLTYLTSA